MNQSEKDRRDALVQLTYEYCRLMEFFAYEMPMKQVNQLIEHYQKFAQKMNTIHQQINERN